MGKQVGNNSGFTWKNAIKIYVIDKLKCLIFFVSFLLTLLAEIRLVYMLHCESLNESEVIGSRHFGVQAVRKITVMRTALNELKSIVFLCNRI